MTSKFILENYLKDLQYIYKSYRYGLSLKRLPSHCGFSKPYGVQHTTSCKKGGFVTLRHNELRDNIAEMLEEVRSEVELDLTLAPEDLGLQDREHSSTLGYFIPTRKAKSCENFMK